MIDEVAIMPRLGDTSVDPNIWLSMTPFVPPRSWDIWASVKYVFPFKLLWLASQVPVASSISGYYQERAMVTPGHSPPRKHPTPPLPTHNYTLFFNLKPLILTPFFFTPN